jgi:hypothetical protein
MQAKLVEIKEMLLRMLHVPDQGLGFAPVVCTGFSHMKRARAITSGYPLLRRVALSRRLVVAPKRESDVGADRANHRGGRHRSASFIVIQQGEGRMRWQRILGSVRNP